MKNLHIDIVQEDEKWIKINNLTPYSIYFELFNIDKNMGYPIKDRIPLGPGNYHKRPVSWKGNDLGFDAITVINEIGELYAYTIKNDKVTLVKPKKISPKKPFVVVTGHQGSGTSIFVKSLKYFGAHNGDDAGNFNNRKAHESVNIRMFFHYVLNKDNVDLKTMNNSFYNAMGVYNYKRWKINILKPLHLHYSQKLVDFLPNTKFISVIKHQEKGGLSPEGKNFNKADQVEILEAQNPQLSGQQIFHMDWNKYFTDYQYAQKVLEYVGFKFTLSEKIFDDMLKAINFDNKKLKK